MTDKLFENFEKILQSMPDKGKGNYVYTAEVQPNGEVKENFQSLDDFTGDSKVESEPINWKRPFSMLAPPKFAFEQANEDLPEYPYHSRVCYTPIQLRWSTFCRDVNNMFNCASMYTRLPRWILLLTVVLVSCFFLWMGIFFVSMLSRMKKHQVGLTPTSGV
jgi:hypothetical protein